MEFVKLYTDWLDHPKTLDLSLSAKGLWLDCLAWAGKHDTGGRIPRAIVRRIAGEEEGRVLAETLVAGGLWEPTGDAWQMHDFDERQPGAGALERARELTRMRVRRHRENHRNVSVALPAVTVTPTDVDVDVDNPLTPSRGGRAVARQVTKKYTDEGDALAKALWSEINPRPLCRFIAFRERVSEVLIAGYTADQLRLAVPEIHAWTRPGVEFALTKTRTAPREDLEVFT